MAYEKDVRICEQWVPNVRLLRYIYKTFVIQHCPELSKQVLVPKLSYFSKITALFRNQNMLSQRMVPLAVKYSIIRPDARSLDMNPIENIFHIMQKVGQAICQQITDNSYEQSEMQVKNTLMSISPNLIDCIMETLLERMTMVVKTNGYRTKC